VRLTYYGYYLKAVSDGKCHLIDLADLVESFVKNGDPKIQKSITYNGDNLYLLPFGVATYLFVQSRDREIIKAIEGSTLTVDDIKAKIGNSSVGFASYVYMGASYLGIASRVLSPRVTAFASFMTQLVHAAGAVNYIFTPRLLTTSVPKSAVANFKLVGAVAVEMDTSNSVAQDVLVALTGITNPTLANIASIEVRITPVKKGKKSLDKELIGIAKTVPDVGLEGIEARAKLELSEQMTDYYISGQGGLRTFVSFENESELTVTIPHLAAELNNAVVAKKVGEFRNDANITKGSSFSDLGIDRQRIAATNLVAQQPVRTAKLRGGGRAANNKRTKVKA